MANGLNAADAWLKQWALRPGRRYEVQSMNVDSFYVDMRETLPGGKDLAIRSVYRWDDLLTGGEGVVILDLTRKAGRLHHKALASICAHIDFETASELDLTEVGAYRYAAHPSTYIRCMAWRLEHTAKSNIWFPGEPLPAALVMAIKYGTLKAWNAQFERLIWEHCMPKKQVSPTFNQWRCSAANARINGLPGSLADCARVMELYIRKGDTALMKKLSDAKYTPTQDEVSRLADYCMSDVDVEHLIDSKLPRITDDELYVYQLNEHINDRGIMVDNHLCAVMMEYLLNETDRLNGKLAKITDGKVTKFTQVARLKTWLYDEFHIVADSLDKAALAGMLRSDGLHPPARAALTIRQDGAKSSTAKFAAMIMRMSDDLRLRGAFIFAGAGQTGRFSSTGAQLHNYGRAQVADVEHTIAQVKRLSPEQFRLVSDEPIIHTASKLLRPALVAAPGKVFVIGDFSSVEAIGLPWIAEHAPEVAEWAAGRDKYLDDAATVFHLDRELLTPEHRQAGKVVRLACGFCGKQGALLAMAEGYGIRLTEDEARRQATAWHAANPWVEKFAEGLEKAALKAVKAAIDGKVGDVFRHGKILYFANKMNGKMTLRCQLPSGRVISYYDVQIEEGRYGGYQLSSIKPRETTRERLWHGLLAENADQSTCNDLLRFALVNLHACKYEVVAHSHDEVVVECDEGHVEAVKLIMEERPTWGADFPLTAKVTQSTRYQK